MRAAEAVKELLTTKLSADDAVKALVALTADDAVKADTALLAVKA